MHSHIYGKKHFEHKTNFGDTLVFSDIVQNKIKETETINEVLFIEIEKGYKTLNKYYIHFDRILSSEYGTFYLDQNNQTSGYAKTEEIEYEVTEKTFSIIEAHKQDFQDGKIPYYTINSRNYIMLDSNFNLDEVVIGKQPKSKPNHNIEYEAFVTLFISEDGARLEHAYQNIKSVNDHEVLIFIERNSGTNLFGTVFRLKKGRNVKTLPETDRIRVAQIARAYGVSIIANELSTMIREELKNENSWFYLLLFKNLQEGSKIIRWGTSTTLTGLSTGLKDISKLINEAKLGNTYWDTQSKDGKGNRNFSPLLPKLPEDGVLNTKELTSKIYSTYIAPLGERLVSFEKQIQEHSFIKKLVRFDATKFVNTLKGIPEILDTFFEVINDKLHEFYYFINGLLVGLINSIVEFFKAIFDILALLLDIINGVIQSTKFFENPTSYLSMFVESFENFIDIITNAFTVENLKKVVSFLAELPKLSFALIKGLFNKVSNVEVAPSALGYYLGFSIGFIASEVVTFFLTGGSGNIAKGLKTVFQSYKSLANTTGKAIRKTVTFTFDTFIKVVKKLLDFSKNIPKYVDELRGLILDFIRKLNKRVLIFSDEILTLYNKLGIVIKKVPQQPVLASGIPVPVGDNIYALIREGKEVFRGSKKEVEELAEKLKKLSKEGAEKYLDEFLETKNYENKLLKVANGEYIKKLLTSNIDIFDKFGKRIFRVSKKDFDTFIKFTKKTKKERKKIIEQVNKELRLRKAKYNPQTAKQKGYDVPLSKNGTSPDFEETPYLFNNKGIVKIQLKGSRKLDFDEAFEKMEIMDNKTRKAILEEYTWHHLDDLDENLGCTMQLVLREAHEATYKHFGSAGQSVFLIPLTKYL